MKIFDVTKQLISSKKSAITGIKLNLVSCKKLFWISFTDWCLQITFLILRQIALSLKVFRNYQTNFSEEKKKCLSYEIFNLQKI